MKKNVLLPNFVTALGLCCGLFVIFKMSMLDVVSSKEILSAAVLLLVAAIFDVLDGTLARAMRSESDFGGFFDSMSDAIVFGVAPSVVALKGIGMMPGTFSSFMLTAAAMVFSVSGVFRLVRYSVTQQKIQGDVEKMAEFKGHFTGLPIPAAALSAVSLILFMISEEGQGLFPISPERQALCTTLALFILGYFMASRWKFPSVKALRFRVKRYETVAFVAILAPLLIIGTINYFPITLFIVTWGYFIVSFILSLTRRILGRRVKALEEFEPEDEPLDE